MLGMIAASWEAVHIVLPAAIYKIAIRPVNKHVGSIWLANSWWNAICYKLRIKELFTELIKYE